MDPRLKVALTVADFQAVVVEVGRMSSGGFELQLVWVVVAVEHHRMRIEDLLHVLESGTFESSIPQSCGEPPASYRLLSFSFLAAPVAYRTLPLSFPGEEDLYIQ